MGKSTIVEIIRDYCSTLLPTKSTISTIVEIIRDYCSKKGGSV